MQDSGVVIQEDKGGSLSLKFTEKKKSGNFRGTMAGIITQSLQLHAQVKLADLG